jgi:putative peptide zinc metalloprotease protein
MSFRFSDAKMNRTGDPTARDPRQLYIRLRKDLHFTLQSYHGKPCYILEDPQEIQFYRLGITEGSFVSMLDGKTPLDSVLRRSANTLGKDAFSEQEAMQIVHWLLETKLAYPSGMLSLEQAKVESGPARNNFNPLAIRIPLVHPDGFFTAALQWCSWLFEPATCGIWICACLAAAFQLTSGWSSFTKELLTVVVPHNWLAILITWVLLKTLHEAAHGLVCRKYGGIVSEMGIMILWGMPVPYVDVTSSWAFRAKRQRMYTALAGLYVELFVAALAVLFWSCTGPGWIHYWCVYIVVVAVVSSLLFNGNPLMRFDGYYVLMDFLEIPNLYGFGQQFWRSVRGKILSGGQLVLPGDSPRQRKIIACYGLVAAIWRCIVYLSLSILTLSLLPFDESQMIWSVIALLTAITLWQFTKRYRNPAPLERASPTRGVLVAASISAGLCFCLFCLSTPFRITAPAIVEYKPLLVVRNYSPGFVTTIAVESGHTVEAGQIIAVLANDELECEKNDLQREIDSSHLTIRTLQHKDEIAALKAEQQKLEALEKRRDEKIEQISRLTVRAPARGTIVSRRPESLVGRYLSEGSEVVLLGDEGEKEIRLSVDQDDVDAFYCQFGKPVTVRAGKQLITNTLSHIAPRASLEPLHPAIAATRGGPLPVRSKSKESQDKKDESKEESFELLSPQFTAEVKLSPQQSVELAAGQRAQVSFTPQGQSIGDFLFNRFQRWCRDKIRRVRNASNL